MCLLENLLSLRSQFLLRKVGAVPVGFIPLGLDNLLDLLEVVH